MDDRSVTVSCGSKMDERSVSIGGKEKNAIKQNGHDSARTVRFAIHPKNRKGDTLLALISAVHRRTNSFFRLKQNEPRRVGAAPSHLHKIAREGRRPLHGVRIRSKDVANYFLLLLSSLCCKYANTDTRACLHNRARVLYDRCVGHPHTIGTHQAVPL